MSTLTNVTAVPEMTALGEPEVREFFGVMGILGWIREGGRRGRSGSRARRSVDCFEEVHES